MSTASKRILIATAILFLLVLSLLTAEGEAALLFTRFGVVAIVAALLFVALIVIFTLPKK